MHIIRMPTRFLGVCILALGLIGVYSIRNSFADCIVGVIFGVLGYILKRLNLPILPIILGMALGGIMEVKLRNSMTRLETPIDLINRPVSGTIFALIVIVLIAHFFALHRERKSST
jgi:putative tricarboxylic transport membrane protein